MKCRTLICLMSTLACLPSLANAREIVTVPTPQGTMELGMQGNETIIVPTPQGTMWQGMQPHPKRHVPIVNERDMVGMPLDDPPVWGMAIGRHHIIDMDRKLDPLKDLRKDDALPPAVP